MQWDKREKGNKKERTKLHITGLYMLRALERPRPRSVAGAPSLFGWCSRLLAGLVGEGGTFIGSTNQGHIPSAAWQRLRVRHIQPERYAK